MNNELRFELWLDDQAAPWPPDEAAAPIGAARAASLRQARSEGITFLATDPQGL